VAAKTSAWILGIAYAIPGVTALVFSGMLVAVVNYIIQIPSINHIFYGRHNIFETKG